MDNQQIWQAVLGELELLVSKANFTTWFKNTGIHDYQADKVVIYVPNNFTKEWLEKKYHQPILKALRSVTSHPIKIIEYRIESLPAGQQSNLFTPKPEVTTAPKQTVVESDNLKPKTHNLNPKYIFSNFIVGKNNELAHAAALAVSKSPGHTYNPLFIYGGVGLGKTHLLQAIGHKINIDTPNKNILYVSCEKFTNDYISAIQNGQASQFEKKYRLIDVLLIDDIQFISGKERTQEAFFHTFNELHQHNKQVVISSDRPPKAIAALEHRLLSRFEWGMIADISIPDLETKMAIIEAKIQEKNYDLEDEIVNYLATVIHNNIRELEGALNRIIAHSQLQNRILTLEEVKDITSSITTDAQRKSITPKHIINVVAEYFDIQIDDIISPCRKKSLAEPRQIIMFLIREELKTSYPTIGQELGGRDHTTVIHAYEKIKHNIKGDDKLRQDIDVLKQKLYTV